MVQDVWPISVAQNACPISDLEATTVRELWAEKAPQLFCDDEEDMLVENGTISSQGKLKG